jgi:hypothetical protein
MALQWSQTMQDLHFEHAVRPVMDDKRTDWDANISLGYPFKVIRDDVIQKGLADFSQGYEHPKYGSLTADEKVLLYCFTNMKLHFFEALETFRYFRPVLKSMFELPGVKMMIDLGCGPGTAGLALADSTKELKLAYIGLDCARPMLRKGSEMLGAANGYALLAKGSVHRTTTSWPTVAALAKKLPTKTNVLMNASYLFASQSLNLDEVCDAVMSFKQAQHVGCLLFTYSNTIGELAGKKWEAFTQKLEGEFSTTGLTQETITFHKKRFSTATSSATYVRQLLVLKK